jgi:hypothetical protein
MATSLQLCQTSAGTTGSEVCSSTCQWSSCCDPAPYQIGSTTVVTDPSSGLQWQRRAAGGVVAYAKAVSACTALGSGWRLPTQPEIDVLLKVSNPSAGTTAFTVNSCAFPIPFSTAEQLSNPISTSYYENRFWTTNAYSPPASWKCATSQAQWVSDLWTGDSNWAACIESASAQALCVK